MTPSPPSVVIVAYNDLLASETSDSLITQLEQAFGPHGYGIIAIRGIPSFLQTKQDCLSQGFPLAHLSPAVLKELEDPDSLYNAGWSHGKEKLKDDQPDLAKASFYFNPVKDVPGSEEDRTQYPLSYPSNKWPTKVLPTLEPASKRLGCLMQQVALELARHLDEYVHRKNANYARNTLHDSLDGSDKVKGRLLYYFPLDSPSQSPDSWIGFHNDSGYLTALAGDLYLDPTTGQPIAAPDGAGLVVEDRNQAICPIALPSDCMAIQIGECTQIITGGALVATPHAVRGAPGVARVSLACFLDVPPPTPVSLPAGTNLSEAATSSTRVPPLSSRWHDGITFGDFLTKTFQQYYSWGQ